MDLSIEFHRYWNNSDHFYTTSPTWKPTDDYKHEGIACKIYRTNVGVRHEKDVKPLYLYRLEDHGDHLYTQDLNEIGTQAKGEVGKHGYRCEGIAGYAHSEHVEGTIPLYRYYKKMEGSGQGDHLYTTNAQEIGVPLEANGKTGNSGYFFEKIACYVFPADA